MRRDGIGGGETARFSNTARAFDMSEPAKTRRRTMSAMACAAHFLYLRGSSGLGGAAVCCGKRGEKEEVSWREQGEGGKIGGVVLVRFGLEQEEMI